jgi:hypothetical protein
VALQFAWLQAHGSATTLLASDVAWQRYSIMMAGRANGLRCSAAMVGGAAEFYFLFFLLDNFNDLLYARKRKRKRERKRERKRDL